MGIKTYFDIQWTGPYIQVDESGKPVPGGTDNAVKCKLLLSPPMLFVRRGSPHLTPF